MKNPDTILASSWRPTDAAEFVGGIAMQNTLPGEAVASELQLGRLTPEFIAEREGYWVPQTGRAWVGCSDDRAVTLLSSGELSAREPELMSTQEGYASVFGAKAGVAKNILVVGVAQYGEEFMDKVGGLDGVRKMIRNYSAEHNTSHALRYTLHTAENNENPDGTFCNHGGNDVGCAYCLLMGKASDLLLDKTHPLIHDTAHKDQIDIFGDDDGVDELLEAHRLVLAHATNGKGAAYALNRPDFVQEASTGTAVMILKGSHAPAQDTGLIWNFEPRTLGNSQGAASDGIPFYRADVVAVVTDVMEIFNEYSLDPELLLRAFVLDSTPVRAALAAGDKNPKLTGVFDPRNLAMGWRGDAQTAITALKIAV